MISHTEDDSLSILSSTPTTTPDFEDLFNMFNEDPIALVGLGRPHTPGPAFPDLCLPKNLHGSFERETSGALHFFKQDDTPKVVKIIQSFVIKLKAHQLANTEISRGFPANLENINLRILFKLWHSFHHEVQETPKQRRG